jgi:hypothetical protein
MEVISEDRRRGSRKRKIRGEEVKEGRGDNRTLRNVRVNNRGRNRGAQEAESRPTTKIGSKPSHDIGVDISCR